MPTLWTNSHQDLAHPCKALISLPKYETGVITGSFATTEESVYIQGKTTVRGYVQSFQRESVFKTDVYFCHAPILQGRGSAAHAVSQGSYIATLDIDSLPDGVPDWEALGCIYNQLPSSHFFQSKSVSGKPKLHFLVAINGKWEITYLTPKWRQRTTKKILSQYLPKQVASGLANAMDCAGYFHTFLNESLVEAMDAHFSSLQPHTLKVSSPAFGEEICYRQPTQEAFRLIRDELRESNPKWRVDKLNRYAHLLLAYISITQSVNRGLLQLSQATLRFSFNRYSGLKPVSASTVYHFFQAMKQSDTLKLVYEGKWRRYSAFFSDLSPALGRILASPDDYFREHEFKDAPLAGTRRLYLPDDIDGESDLNFFILTTHCLSRGMTAEDIVQEAYSRWGSQMEMKNREDKLRRRIRFAEGKADEKGQDSPAAEIPAISYLFERDTRTVGEKCRDQLAELAGMCFPIDWLSEGSRELAL